MEAEELPTFIDTPGYNMRDRLMFMAGMEYREVCEYLVNGPENSSYERVILSENSTRVRLLCGHKRRLCTVLRYNNDYSYMVIHPKSEDKNGSR